MPTGAIYVGRPSRWANPWAIDDIIAGLWGAHPRGNVFMDTALVASIPIMSMRTHARQVAVEMFHDLAIALRHCDPAGFRAWIDPLRGHDLACWCPEGERCHADVLLELANRSGRS